MQARHLGHSDIKISPIGLGCWQFSEANSLLRSYWPALSEEDTNEIVRVALTGEINWFDTAEVYGWGRSEAGLARALKKAGIADGEVIIASKWFPILRFAGSITKTIDKRLEYLKGYSIDLYQIHAPYGSFSSHRSQLKAMAELIRMEKIRTVGISNFNARQMQRAFDHLSSLNIPLVSNQVKYNLLDRSIEKNGVLETAKKLGMTIIAYSPLAQGLLTGKFHDDPGLVKQRSGPRRYLKEFSKKGMEKSTPLIRALKEIAETHEVSPAQVALRWLIQFHGDTIVAIPGATKVSHAKDNIGAMQFELSEKELARLDELSQK